MLTYSYFANATIFLMKDDDHKMDALHDSEFFPWMLLTP